MLINKKAHKILKYIYKHPKITHQKLVSKFPNSDELLDALSYNQYIKISGRREERNCEGFAWYVSLPNSQYNTLPLGDCEVESHQWFNMEYVVSHLFLPIILAIISTLITLFLTNELSQSQEKNPEYQQVQEQYIQE